MLVFFKHKRVKDINKKERDLTSVENRRGNRINNPKRNLKLFITKFRLAMRNRQFESCKYYRKQSAAYAHIMWFKYVNTLNYYCQNV